MFQYSGYQWTKQCFIKTKKPQAIQRFSTQDTNGKYCVSLRQGNLKQLRQGNLKQFNISVLRILTENTVYHALRQGNLKQFNISVLRILMENTVYH